MEVETLPMTLGQKLKELRLSKKAVDKQWTMEFVAGKVGVTSGAISQYEGDKNGPSTDVLLSLAKLYEVSVDDLVNPNEEKVLEENNLHTGQNWQHSSEKTKLFLAELPEKDAEYYIPYYNVEVTAGRMELYFDDVDEIPEGYIYAPQYPGCVMCNVKGTSMYSLIYPGARIYVCKMANFKYIDFGQIYLIVTKDNYRVLKYIRRHPTDDKQVRLVPHNPDHDYWDVEKEDILHLFLVKGYENQTAM